MKHQVRTRTKGTAELGRATWLAATWQCLEDCLVGDRGYATGEKLQRAFAEVECCRARMRRDEGARRLRSAHFISASYSVGAIAKEMKTMRYSGHPLRLLCGSLLFSNSHELLRRLYSPAHLYVACMNRTFFALSYSSHYPAVNAEEY